MRIDQRDWAVLRDHGLDWKVTLDGVPQRLVIWADDEAGELEAFVPGPDGRPQLDPKGPGALTEIRRGKVLFIRSLVRA